MRILEWLFKKKDGPVAAPREVSAGTPSSVPPAPTSDADWEDLSGVPQELSAAEVASLIVAGEAPLLLDVREQHEREASGCIPGSRHIPVDQLPKRFIELDANQPLVLYCASGMRSMDAGAFLLENGFRSVSNMAGGMAAWNGPREFPAKER